MSDKKEVEVKTDYYGIHELQYQQLRKIGKCGWMDSGYKEEQFKRIISFIEKYTTKKKLRILELGCGDAELSINLGLTGHKVSGIDISPTAIEWAKSKATKNSLKADFICESVTNMSFIESTFDVVVDSACLHCIIGKDRVLLLTEVYRILKKCGIFIGETMCNFVPDNFKEFIDGNGLIIKNGVAGRYIGNSDSILHEIESVNFKLLYSVVNVRQDDSESDELVYVFKK